MLQVRWNSQYASPAPSPPPTTPLAANPENSNTTAWLKLCVHQIQRLDTSVRHSICGRLAQWPYPHTIGLTSNIWAPNLHSDTKYVETLQPLPPKLRYHYRPQTKLQEGNVFTPVCHSVHGGSLSQYAPQVTWPGVGLCPGSLCPGGLCPGGVCPGGLCPGGSLPREVSVQGGPCPGGPLSGRPPPNGNEQMVLECILVSENVWLL